MRVLIIRNKFAENNSTLSDWYFNLNISKAHSLYKFSSWKLKDCRKVVCYLFYYLILSFIGFFITYLLIYIFEKEKLFKFGLNDNSSRMFRKDAMQPLLVQPTLKTSVWCYTTNKMKLRAKTFLYLRREFQVTGVQAFQFPL